MRRFRPLLVSWCLLLTGIVCLSQSQAFYQSRDSNYNIAIAGGSGGCSAATTFLARTSGLSGTETTAYTTMICGMITDGTGCSAWSGSSGGLDLLYILATNTTTTANLNLCSTSFSLTASGSPTFAADSGYTGVGGGFLETNYGTAVNAVNFTQNSGQIGIYILNSRTAATVACDVGSLVSNGSLEICPNYTGNLTYYDVNDTGFPTVSSSQAQGSWVAARTSASAMTLYKNESSVGTSSAASATIANGLFSVLAASTTTSIDAASAAWIGSSANPTLIQHRINAYMTALGINVY